MEHDLIRLCRQLLFRETNVILRVGIRSTMNRIYKNGIDDPEIVARLRRHMQLVETPKLKSKLLYAIEALEEDNSSDTTMYQVERIVGFRVKKDNSRMYLVHWKGYDSDDESWEPAHQLIEDRCGDLITKFHREHMRFY
jgi:hypothetical protein